MSRSSSKKATMVALGIDVGTTAVKCAVVDTQTHALLTNASQKTGEYVDCGVGRAEQRVEEILLTVDAALRRLPTDFVQRIESVGVCGQMHGIVWWRAAEVAESARAFLAGEEVQTPAWSRLVTWEDQRCSPQFLAECNVRIRREQENEGRVEGTSSPLSSGYGLATFAHTLATDPEFVSQYDTCGTIHDLLAFVLCGYTVPEQAAMDTTDAFSWGGFDTSNQTWSLPTIRGLGIPETMLPRVMKPGSVVGHTTSDSGFSLPAGVSVFIPMGDHPCSVVAAIGEQSDPASFSGVSLVNIGTSAQLAMILPANSIPSALTSSKSFELRPFINDTQVLGVAAALSGGNTFAWLVQRSQQWTQELVGDAVAVEEAAVYERLIKLGLEKRDTELQFRPTLNGERTNPDQGGLIDELKLHNGSLGDLSAALCCGLVQNLVDMVPEELQGPLRSSRMIGTGNALLRNELLQCFLARVLHDASALRLQDAADAAVGAAVVPGFLNLS